MSVALQSTIGEIAAQSISAVRVFEKFGIDYCCGGKRAIEDVCREKGIDPAELNRALEQSAAPSEDTTDWNVAPLRDLIKHILGTHHEFLKLELPRISERMAKVVNAHTSKDAATITELAATYAALRAELESHLPKEEVMLFPAISRYESAVSQGLPLPPAPFGSIANPIAVMEQEHENAGAALVRIRELTRDFTLPEWACNTVRALWTGLEELEADTHRHIHLENNILHRRTLEMEANAPKA
jgi:regulator of cell morphogenesis and NO signaling